MRPTRILTDKETHPRWEALTPDKMPDGTPRLVTLKQDYIEPEPVGTIVLVPFRIIGYDRDCDGSAMARMENLYVWNEGLDSSGWDVSHISIGDCLVVTENELLQMLNTGTGEK